MNVLERAEKELEKARRESDRAMRACRRARDSATCVREGRRLSAAVAYEHVVYAKFHALLRKG